MPEARKRPCTICRRWFRPDPRIGARQRACNAPQWQTARRQKTLASWRDLNPCYAIAWRIDRRATQLPQPPEPLRLPGPLDQLPWEFANDQFGAQGADFIGVMGALILQAAKDQLSPYLIDPTRFTGTLPAPPEKTSPGFKHTESRAGDDATGVSPTGPAMGAFASPRAAPAAPIAGVAGCQRPADAHRGGCFPRQPRPLPGDRRPQARGRARTTRPGHGRGHGLANERCRSFAAVEIAAQRPARQRRLLASLADSGQQTPIVVVVSQDSRDRYLVIDGHKRVAAITR